jgi:hypothetical protein
VTRCLFESYHGGTRSLSLDNVLYTRLSANVFVDHGSAEGATCILLTENGIEAPSQVVTMDHNVFCFAAGPDSGAPPTVAIYDRRQRVDLQGNTFIRCGLESGAGGGAASLYANNIFFRSTVRLSGSIGGLVSCNDAWPQPISTDVPEIYTFTDNISADPRFCGEASGDFRVAIGGPCDPRPSSPCGLIGALPAACQATPVEQTSWGSLKARFLPKRK